ncbi:MAG: hypothetical protein LBN27_02920 [Prevotellaceae bacterium]|jgi:hypothetical protein|nr:hypothetical protein [Prevotellaceae bacterium]
MKQKILFLGLLLAVWGACALEATAQKKGNITQGFVISPIPPQTYSGSDITPLVSVRDGKTLLVKDKDYTLEYRNNKNVGTATVTIKAPKEESNYSESITKEFQIVKAKLVITVDGKQGKFYGYPDPVLTYKIGSGELKGSDALKGSLTRDAGEEVGNYLISQGTLDAGPNYDLTVGRSYFVIQKSPITIKAEPNQKKVYGDKDQVIKYTIEEGTLLSAKSALNGELGRMAGENVGTYAITQGTLSAGNNYEVRFVRENFEITPAPLTVKADAKQTKMYNDPDPIYTYSITAGKLAEGDNIRGYLSREAGENIGKYNITQGTLTAGSNYDMKYVPDTFEIIRKPFSK